MAEQDAWPTLRDIVELLLGGGIGGAITAWVTLRREKREELASVFASYDADIAILKLRLERATTNAEKDSARERLEALENERLEQSAAYRSTKKLTREVGAETLRAEQSLPRQPDKGRLEGLIASSLMLDAAFLDAVDYLARGNSLAILSRLEEAHAQYSRATTLAPGMALAWNNDAVVLYELRRAKESLASSEEAVRLEPGNALYLANLSAGLALAGRFEEGVAAATAALDAQPDLVVALTNRAANLRNLGRVQEAIRDLQESLARDPTQVASLHGLAAALRAEGRNEEALVYLDRELALGPRLPAHTLYDRAEVLSSLGRSTEALVDVDRSLAHEADYAPAIFLRAKLRFQAGLVEEARQDFTQALALAARNAVELSNLSAHWNNAGNADWAEEAAAAAIRADDRYGRGHMNRGIALTTMGNLDAARAELTRAVELNGEDDLAHLNLAFTLQRHGDIPAMLSHAERAVRLNPTRAAAHQAVGAALMLLDRPGEARVAFERAISLEPTAATHHYNLATSHARAGQPTDALASLRRAVTLDPDIARRAKDDHDFQSLRGSPRYRADFAALVGAEGI